MGLELIIAGVSALAGVFGAVASSNAASNAAAAQREASDIQGAQNQVQSSQSRRQRIREGRIRRAQIIAASENQGTSSSSGEVGAIGALNTNLSGLIGNSLGESKANAGINRNTQRAADFTAQGNAIGAWTNVIQSGLGGFSSIFDN